MLFDMMLSTRLDDPVKHVTIRACTASEKPTVQAPDYNPVPFVFGAPEKRSVDEGRNHSTCATDMHKTPNQTTFYYHEWLTDPRSEVSGNINDTIRALDKLMNYLDTADNCKPSVMFAKARQTVAGVFAGSLVDKQSATLVAKQLVNSIQNKADYEAGRIAIQNCRGILPTVWGLGIVADLQGNMTAVQESLAGWNDAKCLESPDLNAVWRKMDLELWSVKNTTGANGTREDGNSTIVRRASDKCRAERVEAGDDCASLAKRCGVSATQFNKYNSGAKFCSTLKPKQHVCCTAGELPDFRPQPDANGNCHAVDINNDDGCWEIADANYLTVKEVEELNKNTWGFAGCKNLQPGQKLCLSKGNPPMPNTISNAVCGPQKPNGEARGTKKLADMNPCPLNVCCNVWGQCGMDGDFCTEAPADTGAPGTSKPGANGCISNCGMEITNNDKGPVSFSHIAYFEAWNQKRPCLHMDVSDIDKDKYTHIHFAFPDVTPGDFSIDVSKLKSQFDKMKKMSGIKKIVSLGGWAFSAEAPTYSIFREAVLPANRAKFAANVVSFVNQHDLDGIDFDWEYPAAEDLPDIPSANPDEGKDYLEFLKMVKRRLPNKSVSIAAPSSYWYLRGFPIKDIAKVVDYIVYMTYDLHGQWDHGNKWSSPGCENGNCLRSHINMTETKTSLAMITKAGVPSNKIFVGIASYGRSFKMSKAGYIVVYQETEWVAWMNDKTKSSRIDLYKGLNFGGVSDWAVDLDKDYGDSGIGSGDDDDSNLSGGKNCPLNKSYSDLDELANDDTVADDCKPVLALHILEGILDKSLEKYADVDNGYEKNFAAYRRVMKAAAKETMWKFSQWREGAYTKWFDCDFKDLDNSKRDWKGPCDEMADHVDSWLEGVMIVKVTLRDDTGFWEGLEEETGIIEDWVEFGDFKQNTDPAAGCNPPPPPGQNCEAVQFRLSVEGIPVLKDDFDIPDPKDLIKDVTSNLEEIRTGIASRFFDVVAGIWDGGNGDVLQVVSVLIFLLAQAVDSMEEAKEKGGEIIKQEKENHILNIISALLFFIPFVGEFAAMAAGAATVSRMIALAGMVGNTAFSIAEVVGNPENAAMAIMALLSAGRVRKPKDYVDLGAARRAQTNAGVKRMGPTFKKHDDSLQKVLGNCRKDGGKDEDEPSMCKAKRDLGLSGLVARGHIHSFMSEETYFGLPVLRKRQSNNNNNNNNKNNCGTTEHKTTTTSIETFLSTPARTCSSQWGQACYHYSSVMSVHTNTPDMVRWTCWATTGTSKHGKATDDWGLWTSRKKPHARTMQHNWDWGAEWTEEPICHRDEWPPLAFWPQTRINGKMTKKPGQFVRLLPGTNNLGAAILWNAFCKHEDGYSIKAGGVTSINPKKVTTTSTEVNSEIKGGTTTYITSVGIKIPNAVFEIKHWEQPAAKDDGLWENKCWPSMILPDDPGYALLTDDPWYQHNPNAQASTAVYNVAPLNAVTSGKTKWTTYSGRPLIAARSIDDDIDIPYGATPMTCKIPVQVMQERSIVVDEDEGEYEYEEILPSDIDCSKLAQAIFAPVPPPTLSSPRKTSAVASAVIEVREEVEKEPTPGSVVLMNVAEPTEG
ncbi:hypothetical protein B0J15DRAFT_530791 [Fusarium solani]|uniref:chitinase n=1 Tax=Fusarium solani TaxID=169388 RepID=A0A9P9G1S4_FUSSL|nr:uncharacterized protein B0J15DRAFT_530791 [Fusarium solani]KAH7228394.1 hypothetical protein B0J15DRAFT_530791 [Fusarium solani]